ncbi:MAG TPA: hypothetical protein VG675_11665 [Bryobacteraceae bacterium]|nr:hypothetical protein [Bryobacteraceae bacterium]
MIRVCLLALTSLVFSGMAADHGFKATFVGGTAPGVEAKSSARLDLSNPDVLIFRSGKTEIRIPYRKVESLEYGQNVSRRYAAAVLISPLLLLSKSRKHFVTIGYEDKAGKQQALVFRVGKGDIRSVLASLEARTGRRVEYQDDEARKAGKG